ESELFWINPGTHSPEPIAFAANSTPNRDGVLVRRALSGGDPEVLATGEPDPSTLRYLPAAPLYPMLAWTNVGLSGSACCSWKAMATLGGAPRSMSGGGAGLTFDSDRVYGWTQVSQVMSSGSGFSVSSVVTSYPR